MKIRSFVITAVLAIAILSSTGFVGATTTTDTQTLIAQLQAQIQSLLQQIAQLQAQQGTTIWCHTFNINLGIGSTSKEVIYLVQALSKQNIQGFTYTGGDVANFNEGIASAVSAFQQRYASEILTPSGLKYPTGYVGPATRAKLNALYGCGITTCPIELPNCLTGTTPQSYVGTDGCTHWKCVPLTVCPQDMYTCPNGISVPRTGPNCQFVCPSTPCPQYVPPAPGWCSGGTIQPPVMGSDGCYGPARCVYGDNKIVINSVSGPNSLNVGQTGTWSVNATAPSGTNLTYLVDWGDVVYPTGVGVGSANINQTSTFTHSYSQAGTYTIRFKVIDSNVCTVTASCDKSAQTSITVVVGSAAQCYTDADCPSVCPACATGTAPSCGGGPCYTYKCLNGKCVANTQPSIISLSPSSGPVGTSVTITGSGFAPTGNAIYFGDWVIKNISSSNGGTNITFTVPNVALCYSDYGPISCQTYLTRIPGTYNVQVITNPGAIGAQPSNALIFNVTSSTTQPSITINSVSGPNSLNVSQTGTWVVNATAPSGTNLTYSVDWGDNYLYPYPTSTGLKTEISQTTTFTHSYSQAGTYTVKFTVSAPSVCPSCPVGVVCQLEPCIPNSATTSITVVVGSATQCYTDADCPSVCAACMAMPGTTCGGCITYKCVSGKCVPSTQPSIKVVSPNGGEQWAVGSIHNITWTSNGVSTVTIEIIKNDSQGWTPGPHTIYTLPASAGSYSWIVPTIPPGTDFKIKIYDKANTSISDLSDNYFTITSTQPIVTAYSAKFVDNQLTYTPGQTIKFSVKGLASDLNAATPDKGFNVQAWMQTIIEPLQTVQINGTYQSVNATYNPNTKYWDVVMTAPSDASQKYKIEAALYCANSSYGCSYGQINESFTFTVSSAVQWQIYTNNLYGFSIKYPSNYPPVGIIYGWPHAIVLFSGPSGQSYYLAIEWWNDTLEFNAAHGNVQPVFKKIGSQYISLWNINKDPIVDQMIATFVTQ